MYKLLVDDEFIETMKKVPSEFLLILISTIITMEKVKENKNNE